HVLEEEGRTLLLVNAQHVKAVPGHKPDVKESEWLADPARAMGCCMPALSRPNRSGCCAISRGIASPSPRRVAHPADQPHPPSAGNRQPETGSGGEQGGGRKWAAHAARRRTRGVRRSGLG